MGIVAKRKPFSWSERLQVWNQSEGICAYCGKQTRLGHDFSVDHVVPVSRGGEHRVDNFVACCRSCNSRKGALSSDEFKHRLSEADVKDSVLEASIARYKLYHYCRRRFGLTERQTYDVVRKMGIKPFRHGESLLFRLWKRDAERIVLRLASLDSAELRRLAEFDPVTIDVLDDVAAAMRESGEAA